MARDTSVKGTRDTSTASQSPTILLIAQKEPSTLIDLHGAGFRVMAVNYAEFSMDAIKSLRPGVIILDSSVPINAAQTLGDFLKNDRNYGDIPVLLLLKRLTDYPLPSASSFRPDYSLIEPFTLGELSAGIEFLLQPKGARKPSGNSSGTV